VLRLVRLRREGFREAECPKTLFHQCNPTNFGRRRLWIYWNIAFLSFVYMGGTLTKNILRGAFRSGMGRSKSGKEQLILEKTDRSVMRLEFVGSVKRGWDNSSAGLCFFLAPMFDNLDSAVPRTDVESIRLWRHGGCVTWIRSG